MYTMAFSDMTTAELVGATRCGDSAAADRLLERFRPMACGYALGLLGDSGLAEDACQEACIDAFLHLDQLHDPAAFPGWFRRVVLKHADRQRRRRLLYTELVDVPGAVDPLAAVIEAESRREVIDSVASLSPRLREAVRLFYLTGLSVAEVAEFLEIAPSAVKKRLFDARARLRQTLAPSGTQSLPTRTGGMTMDAAAPKMLATGIRAVDLFGPLTEGAGLAISGDPAAGEAVLALEIAHNLAVREGLTAHFFVRDTALFERSVRESKVMADVSKSDDISRLEMKRDGRTIATILLSADPVAASWVTMTRDLLVAGQLPAIDAIRSGSRLDLGEHGAVAGRARDAIAEGRGEALLQYLRQPFYVAEPWTGKPAEYTELQETLESVTRLINA